MSEPFQTVRAAALAVLNLAGVKLKQREGQFLGGIAFSEYELTPKQLKWLVGLLKRNGLPPLADGCANG